MPTLKKLLPIVAILLIAWALLTIRIGAAWTGHHDANGAWTSVAVRNWQWHGFLNGMVIYNEGFDPAERFEYYTHHPPFSAYLAAPLVLLAGFDEALIRFPSAAVTLISAAALYVLVRRLSNARRAAWAALLYALTPMIGYFGRMPNYEAPGLMFTLLFAAVLVQWIKTPTRARWIALAALVVGIVWTAWAADMIAALLGVVALLTVRPSRRIAVIALGVVGAVALFAMIALFAANYPAALDELRGMFLFRTSDASLAPGSAPFTWGDYVVRQLGRFITLFTPTILALALIGAPGILRERKSRPVLIALLLGGLAYILLFRNAAYVHDYYAIYLTIPLAISAAAAITPVRRARSRWARPLVVALILATPIPALVYLSQLHASADGDQVLQVAAVVHDNSEPGSIILSNLPDTGWAMGFYAERSVEWLISPADAIQRANASEVPTYYLYCDEYSTLPADAPIVREIDINADCRLALLR
ncbi:MAG: glycosyltransferase family 39 protein [Anaerolinea sp.]|nr:glycosyltransferase family 39 protein [Anaerolinea sp.]